MIFLFSSEELLVSVNTQTGGFLVHAPQFHPIPPLLKEIQQTLNSPPTNVDKLKTLVSQMRFWVTERRCEKTLQHLPATATDGIRLLNWEENQILSRIGPHRITIKFQKHPYAILVIFDFSQLLFHRIVPENLRFSLFFPPDCRVFRKTRMRGRDGIVFSSYNGQKSCCGR